jgi:hypothetical protein
MEKIRFLFCSRGLKYGTKLMMEIKKQFEEIMSQTSILSTKTLSDVQRQAFLDANFDL